MYAKEMLLRKCITRQTFHFQQTNLQTDTSYLRKNTRMVPNALFVFYLDPTVG